MMGEGSNDESDRSGVQGLAIPWWPTSAVGPHRESALGDRLCCWPVESCGNAGGCSIRLESRDYTAERPEFLSWPEAEPLIRSAFGPLERASFRMLGIRQFMRLHVVPAES